MKEIPGLKAGMSNGGGTRHLFLCSLNAFRNWVGPRFAYWSLIKDLTGHADF